MHQTFHHQTPRIVLQPGEYYVVKERVILSTLLGSCVAACLYDSQQGIIGMNHFLLANRRYSKSMPVMDSEAGRYGIHAMELLVNKMLAAGAQKQNLRAKAFGGGNVLALAKGDDAFPAVGEVNSRFIIEFLRNDRIPLVASDLGGTHGRVIHFSSLDYSVYVKQIANVKATDLVETERRYWQDQLKQRTAGTTTSAEFW